MPWRCSQELTPDALTHCELACYELTHHDLTHHEHTSDMPIHSDAMCRILGKSSCQQTMNDDISTMQAMGMLSAGLFMHKQPIQPQMSA